MERGMSRMPAIVEEILRRLMLLPDLQKFPVRLVRFTEVATKPALPVVNLCHQNLLAR
jgi:hypothetical protein